ncbi:MAG: PaaI family thioesterase [Candidatus Edwardsbacteria bacterium]
MQLLDDEMCFACGKKNEQGLKLSFTQDKDGVARAFFTPEKKYQGWNGILHGGIISTLLDEAMAQAAAAKGLKTVTIKLNIQFKKPAIIGEKILLEGSIKDDSKKIVHSEAILKREDGTILALAQGKLVKRK